MGLLGETIGGILGIAQSAINAKTARRNTDETNKANKRLAEYAYNKDLEMWNRQNEYNSPSAQMERFNQAGLNPNLIYGQGNAGNATTIPRYQAPSMEFNYQPAIDLTMALSRYQDFQVKQAQIDNLREQNRLIKLNADLKYYEKTLWEPPGTTPLYSPEIPIKSQLAYYQAEIKKAEAKSAGMMLAKKMENIDLSNELKQKQVNWYIANQLSNMATKALGAIGISKFANRLRPAPRYYK